MRKIFIALGLALLAMPAPAQTLKPTLKEVLSIGSEDGDYFTRWTGIAVDETGCIYVVDLQDCVLRKFDAEGRLVAQTGRKGQGPGEFDSPVIVGIRGDRVYVSQIYKPGFMLFDLDLKYLETRPSIHAVSAFLLLKDGRILVSSFGYSAVGGKAGSWLLVLDSKGGLETKIPMPEGSGFPGFDVWELALDAKGGVLAVNHWADRVVKLDPKGRVVYSAHPLGVGPSTSQELGEVKGVGKITVPTQMLMKSVQFDSQGRAYVLRGSPAEHPSRDVLILDEAGKIIGGFTLPEPSHMIYIDGKDFLYYRSGGGTTVKKVRLEY